MALKNELRVGIDSEKCNLSKLNSIQISETKENENNLNQRELGELYNVTQSNISCILKGKS